jgi:CDP-4-dehydro-6-deoxyglucose reductase
MTMSYKIIIEPSGHSFDAEENEVILDAALRHGLSIPYGCRNGICGACKGKIVEGQVAYVDGCPGALSTIEERIGQTICCRAQARSDLVLEIHEVTSSQEVPIRKMPSRVVKMERLADDVMRLFLKLPDNDRLQFLAGQYIDIMLPDGRRRSFSIANAPHDDQLIELHIRLITGGVFTSRVFTEMKEKDILRIEGPFGTFYLDEASTRPIILVAGGTGFAPVKGMIEHAIQSEMKQPIYLYWGARALSDLYLNDLPTAWKERANIYYLPVLSAPKPEDQWRGRTGLVPQAVLDDFSDLSGYELYVSGPPAMVDAMRQGAIVQGLPKEQFHFDSFEFAGN